MGSGRGLFPAGRFVTGIATRAGRPSPATVHQPRGERTLLGAVVRESHRPCSFLWGSGGTSLSFALPWRQGCCAEPRACLPPSVRSAPVPGVMGRGACPCRDEAADLAVANLSACVDHAPMGSPGPLVMPRPPCARRSPRGFAQHTESFQPSCMDHSLRPVAARRRCGRPRLPGLRLRIPASPFLYDRSFPRMARLAPLARIPRCKVSCSAVGGPSARLHFFFCRKNAMKYPGCLRPVTGRDKKIASYRQKKMRCCEKNLTRPAIPARRNLALSNKAVPWTAGKDRSSLS